MADVNQNTGAKVLEWLYNGSYSFWDNPLPERQVRHVSEEFLEGLVLSDGVDDDEGYFYPVEARRKYCDDAPNRGANIPASVKGNTIGLYTGTSKSVGTELMHQVEMTFTFYNLDGTNHDDNSQTLLVWVKDTEVKVAGQTDKVIQKKLEVVDNNTKPPIDPAITNVKDLLPITKQSAKKKLSTGLIIGIVAAVLILLVGGYLLIRKKNKDATQAQFQQTGGNGYTMIGGQYPMVA
jgi:hypothetical protein